MAEQVPKFSADVLGAPVLVTGSNGYFASWLVRALCDIGFTNVIAGDIAGSFVLPATAQYTRLDVTDASSIEAALRRSGGVRTVFHCAALVPFNLSRRYTADEIRRVNVVGTANVVRAARANGVRNLIYASSTGVSFRGKDIEGGDEITAPPPDGERESNDVYSASKAEAEAIVLEGR